MRRLTGSYDGIDYALIEYADGQVECPPAVLDLFQQPDGSLPTGAELEQVCRLFFGESFRVEEVA